MNRQDHIRYWLDSAAHDWDAAVSLFASGKYDWSLFIGHLVLEKILKALFVQNNEGLFPPKTHNLVKLAENAEILVTDEQKFLLDEVNDFNIEVRYPIFRDALYKKCTKEFAEHYFTQIEDLAQWLKSQLKYLP